MKIRKKWLFLQIRKTIFLRERTMCWFRDTCKSLEFSYQLIMQNVLIEYNSQRDSFTASRQAQPEFDAETTTEARRE